MNIKDFTLKLNYVSNGVCSDVSIDGDQLANGFENDVFALEDAGCQDCVKILLNAKQPVKFNLAELIYDHYFETQELFYVNGYQSWTTSREYGHGDRQYGLRGISWLFNSIKTAGATGDYGFTEYGKDLYHSFTYTYLRNGEKVDLLGSLNERSGYTIFYADMRENILAVVKDLEGITIDGDYELFNVVHTSGSYDEAFDRYFDLYPRKSTGRVDHFAGYTSWYNYYQKIDEKIILRDFEGLKRAGSSANIFQIDDGFETRVGDWTIDTNKFPNGLASIVEKVHASGLKAGLWLAPFSAEFRANIVKDHPEWFIKDEKGKKLFGGTAWGGFYVLDYELDEVKKYIKELFDTVFDEWGFDMVKLDFLYSQAIRPRNNKTRGQIMCEAMDFLRECCRDKLLLGCGVPLGPAFGVVDACRISCDVENSFAEKAYVKSTNQEIISAREAINNSIFRRHLNGRIFANDPDVFFLRDDGMIKAKYNMTQKRLLALVNHIFGKVLFVSDDIGAYDDEKMQILLDAYKPFDGKVISAEYLDADNLKVVYVEGGSDHTLTFNIKTGEYTLV